MNRARRAQQAGYTLVELLIVVLIIAISTLVFTPAISLAASHRRLSMSAREVIRIGRRARTDTFSTLRAHLLWVNPATMTLQLLRGPTNSCTLTSWSSIQGDCPATGVPVGRCLEVLKLSDVLGDTTASMNELKADNSTTQGTRALCYAPNGLLYYGAAGTALNAVTFSTANASTINGGFIYQIFWSNVGTLADASRIHRVLFPLGGTARAIR